MAILKDGSTVGGEDIADKSWVNSNFNNYSLETHNNTHHSENYAVSNSNVTFASADFTGAIRPKTNPTLGSQSVSTGNYYTPPRGLYNSSWGTSVRGSIAKVTSGSYEDVAKRGGDGPYAGNSNTRIYNMNDNLNSIDWYYARF